MDTETVNAVTHFEVWHLGDSTHATDAELGVREHCILQILHRGHDALLPRLLEDVDVPLPQTAAHTGHRKETGAKTVRDVQSDATSTTDECGRDV
jgi:hypothetical protein